MNHIQSLAILSIFFDILLYICNLCLNNKQLFRSEKNNNYLFYIFKYLDIYLLLSDERSSWILCTILLIFFTHLRVVN